MTATKESLGSESNQSLSAVAAACQDWQHPKSTDYKIGACKSISWRASVEVCQWDGSNQKSLGSESNQKSLGSESNQESLGSESNLGVSR